MDETIFRCPQCGGNVQFDPGQQSLKCPYCAAVIKIEDARRPDVQHEIDFVSALATFETLATEEIRIVHCSACGGDTTFAPNVDSGPCDFCGTNIVAAGPTNKAMKPQYLLPFTIDKAKAEDSFRTWLRHRWFAPNALKKLARIEKPLTGVYFPYWTFDADTESRYTGERGENYTVQVQEKDSQGNTVTRTEVRTRWFPASGTVSRAFDDVLVPASHSLPPKLSTHLNDWELGDMVEYNPAFLSGFKSESYSNSLQSGFDDGKAIMGRTIESDVRASIGGDQQRVFSIDTRYSNITFKYVQLPVWSLMYRFGKKFYSVLVSGQTGKVAGDRPYSPLKIIALIVLVAALAVGGFLLYKHFHG